MRKTALQTALLIGFSCVVAITSGCRNIWRDNFVGAPIGFYDQTDVVDVREVPWDRVESVLAQIEDDRAASDTHWKDWTKDELMGEQARLLRGLQISEDPEDIVVLGRSVFRSVESVSPYGKELDAFAREIGADYAVYSANFIGKSEKIVREPISRSGTSLRGYRDSSGNYRSEFVPWSETVYVPVVVEANEYAWVVYFLRRK